MRGAIVFASVLCCIAAGALRNDQEHWNRLARNELEEALGVKRNYGTAKNVIIFMGDGMGPNAVTATKIFKGGESFRAPNPWPWLVYEKYPHIGLLEGILRVGRQVMVSNSTGSTSDPLNAWSCPEKDERNPIEEYKKDQENQQLNCSVVTNNKDLNKINANSIDSIPIDQDHWSSLAKNELEEALAVKWNLGTAKNVIIFIGDGMGPNTVTATRIYKGGESHRLVYEKFPHTGLLKTYAADTMVSDSASTATAMLCGVKTNQDAIGVDATVPIQDCPKSLQDNVQVDSLAAIALKAGKSAGLVTTMRVTHATPGPVYAHSPDRRWECEATMPAEAFQCKDIARQLVEDWPGKDLQVILGGGRQVMVSGSTGSTSDPLDTWSCQRKDGRNLIEDYKRDKEHRQLKYSVVANNKDLNEFDLNSTDYLLGIFANGHLQYEHERNKGPEGMPSISDMVEAALKVLSKNENGYFLMVEGGNIDMAHHRGKAKKAIDESAAMEEAVQLAAAMTDEEDTLLIVTSDHTHTLSINGYPERGSNLFGIARASRYDGINYTTLSYATGGPGSLKYEVKSDGDEPKVVRKDPSEEDINSFEYEQNAGIILEENSHGGGDVNIFARGPYAHLFHNIHEQHYVYHVACYAAKMGPYSQRTSNSSTNFFNLLSFMTATLFFFIRSR